MKYLLENRKFIHTFATLLRNQSNMVVVVQLVRASDCGSECRGFESHQPPKKAGIIYSCFSLFFYVSVHASQFILLVSFYHILFVTEKYAKGPGIRKFQSTFSLLSTPPLSQSVRHLNCSTVKYPSAYGTSPKTGEELVVT